ncbi:MAG: TadE family protein [Pirellulaceae bacterium]
MKPLLANYRESSRRGTATVEFAIIAPVFLTLLLGLLEATKLFEIHGLMAQAARDGARMGAMDRADWVANGQRSNDKIIRDIKNNLAAAGMDPDKVEVAIEIPNQPGDEFDLDDPANDLGLFQVRISIPYGDVSSLQIPGNSDYSLSSAVVFRNTRSTIVN